MSPGAASENEKLASRPMLKEGVDNSTQAQSSLSATGRTVLGELPTNKRLKTTALDDPEKDETPQENHALAPVTAAVQSDAPSLKRLEPDLESPDWRKRVRANARRELIETHALMDRGNETKAEGKENSPAMTHAFMKRSSRLALSLDDRLELALARDVDARFEKAKLAPHDDIDSDYRFDPIMVQEYEEDIFSNLYQSQKRYQVGDYISNQAELGWDHRGVVINWLISVHAKFRLVSETLFIAVNLMDRYLERKEVPLSELQKVGLTCLFIATKYEEVMCPAVQIFAYMANLEGADLVKTERDILLTIEWTVVYTHPLNFLRRISKIDDYNDSTRTFAKYLLEVSLMIPKLIQFMPSTIAAASACLSRAILNTTDLWDDNAYFYSGGYTQGDLEPLMEAMVEYLAGPIFHDVLFKKFSSRKFLKASVVCREWAKSQID